MAKKLPSIKSNINHSDRAHARRPPSTLKWRELCCGYRPSQNRKFEVYSNEGTAMHEAVEQGTADHLDEHAMILAINNHKVGRMLGEQRDCVTRILDYLKPIEKKALKVEREVRLPIAPEWGVDFGTVDFLATMKDNSVDMADFKFGKHPVDPAEYNAQFAIGYVLGLFRHRPACNEVRVHILQPRVMEDADTGVYLRKDLPALELRLATIISREEYGDPKTFNPTYEGCLYCGRKATCPKLATFALKVAKKADEFPTLLLDKLPLTVDACKNDPDVIAGLKELSKVMEEWASAASAHATQWAIDNAMDLPGYALSEKRGGRFFQSALLAWNEVQDLWVSPEGDILKSSEAKKLKPSEQMKLKSLMSQDEFLTAVSRIDFDAFDKLVASQIGRGQKGKAVEKVGELLAAEGILQRYPGSKYLRRLRRGE